MVLLTLSSRLLLVHYSPRLLISSQYAFSSLFEIWLMKTESSANFTTVFSGELQSWLYSVNRRGLSTQLWGAPVFDTTVEEVWPSIQTVWGLFVRKSTVQLQSVVLKPKMLNLPISYGRDCVECWVEMDVWWTCCYFVKVKMSGGQWRCVLCGSVGSECKLMRVQAGWDGVFDVLNQFLKALHQNQHFIGFYCLCDPNITNTFADVWWCIFLKTDLVLVGGGISEHVPVCAHKAVL